ncbi:uncharacterized protein N7518_003902 [Penicillium psychrosexuale]|uniref:uncharacterized protein n=1 Tax=Penicillium psychrosexuale TaxID=1002107 RepID=UPI0025450E1A|nr:uncharacterized protein N7518_003902 [Penicillium psychrosexuale]KAJ5795362.1 hypothetical protein N7518_003902 [Penicillium psychrosexuale]
MFAIPIPLLIKAQLKRRRKVVLIGVMSLGLFTIIAAILNKNLQFYSPHNTTYQICVKAFQYNSNGAQKPGKPGNQTMIVAAATPNNSQSHPSSDLFSLMEVTFFIEEIKTQLPASTASRSCATTRSGSVSQAQAPRGEDQVRVAGSTRLLKAGRPTTTSTIGTGAVKHVEDNSEAFRLRSPSPSARPATLKKNKGVQPDIRKIAGATEEATDGLLGTFIFAGLTAHLLSARRTAPFIFTGDAA